MIRPLTAALAMAGVAVVACGGDYASAPSAARSDPDAGADADTSDAGLPAMEAGPGSCVGQPFGPVEMVSFDVGGEPATEPQDVRLVGTHAYFAALQGDSVRSLFRGTFVPATTVTAPVITQISEMIDPGGENDDGPTAMSDESSLVFAHGTGASRSIWSAFPTTGDAPFNDTGNADGMQFAASFNDFAPYFAGAPTRALYFTRGKLDGTGNRLYRASVTASSNQAIGFGPIAAVNAPCPVGANDSCSAPVVTPDEKLLFFATTTVAAPATSLIQENTLGEPSLVAHAELGPSYPTWISPDGCEILTNSVTVTGSGYAKRAPK